MINDSKTGLPMFVRSASDVIGGMRYNTQDYERIGHKITNSEGLTANEFYIIYRTPGGRYVKYEQKQDRMIKDQLIQKPEINLIPIKKAEAQELYESLDDKQMTFNETFSRVVNA